MVYIMVNPGKIDTGGLGTKLFEQLRDAAVAGEQEPGPPSRKNG